MISPRVYVSILAGSFAALPLSVSAKSFKEIVDGTIVPFGERLIELIFVVIFIVFLIGMVRFFFSDSPESREKGKYFAVYGVVGLAILFTVWGFVRILLSILDTFNT